jgi:hypothetical protein
MYRLPLPAPAIDSAFRAMRVELPPPRVYSQGAFLQGVYFLGLTVVQFLDWITRLRTRFERLCQLTSTDSYSAL